MVILLLDRLSFGLDGSCCLLLLFITLVQLVAKLRVGLGGRSLSVGRLVLGRLGQHVVLKVNRAVSCLYVDYGRFLGIKHIDTGQAEQLIVGHLFWTFKLLGHIAELRLRGLGEQCVGREHHSGWDDVWRHALEVHCLLVDMDG